MKSKTVSSSRVLAHWVGMLATTVFMASCMGQQVQRSDVPLSLAEARRLNLSVPFPNSATDIYYVFEAGGMQEMLMLVKFRVPPQDADKAIDDIVAANNLQMKRSLAFARKGLPAPRPATPYVNSTIPSLKPVPWFVPQSIRNGYMRSESTSYAPAIWYDADHSVVYLLEAD